MLLRGSILPARLILFICMMLSTTPGVAFETDLSGQVSIWGDTVRQEDQWYSAAGIRFIPQFTMKQQAGNTAFIDAEVSVNAFLVAHTREDEDHHDVDLYRAKLRYATARTETRLGRQQINFGPARLLRVLKWFDQLDPSDPLNLTDGVNALRFRYVCQDNAGFWAWGVYGNDQPKGNEILASDPDIPEFGGRLFHPVLNGEMAVTAHTRQVGGSIMDIPDYTENRFALDGKWDIGPGIWFEALFQHSDTQALPYAWTKQMTLGLDYTFNTGSGLYCLMEHMIMTLSEEMPESDEGVNISAFSIYYPIGMIDNLRTIGYYLWDATEYGLHVGWQRTYDKIMLDFSVFRYPEDIEYEMVFRQNTLSGGFGAQILLIYYH